MSEHYVRDWDNLVEHINEMHGVTERHNLPAAVADLSRAVREGHVILVAGHNNALTFSASPTRRADMGMPRPTGATLNTAPAG